MAHDPHPARIAEDEIGYTIRKLTLQPGDVVVLKCSGSISEALAHRLKEHAREALPDGVKVLVLDKDIDVGAIEFLRFRKQ